MTQSVWTAVDSYFEGLFVGEDAALAAAQQTMKDANMPAIAVSPMQGKLLYTLARMHRARFILEIGTLGGYSTIWLGRALPEDGRLISLEIDARFAEIARANIARAGLDRQVEVRVGAAIDTLPRLAESGASFDLVFIDADKASTPQYLDWALRLTQAGSLIIVDNVVRGGAVSEADNPDANIQGVRRALQAMAENPRLITSAAQTVGSKGYDGFALALVTG